MYGTRHNRQKYCKPTALGSQKMYPTDRQTTVSRAFPLKRMQQQQQQTWSHVGCMSCPHIDLPLPMISNNFFITASSRFFHIPYVSLWCSGSWLVMMLPLCLSDYRQPRPCKQETIFRWLIRIHLRRRLQWKQYVQWTKLSHQKKRSWGGPND